LNEFLCYLGALAWIRVLGAGGAEESDEALA
jgi:hypothetical protein